MWLKIYYPIEFMCALLTYGTKESDKDKERRKNEYIEEAFRLGIEIRPPKIGISEPNLWKICKNILYMPFSEIKGIGEKTAQAFMNIKDGQGFYESGKSKKKIPDKYMKILDEIGAYEDEPLNPSKAAHISSFLGVSIAYDFKSKYKKLYDLISQYTDDFDSLDQKDLLSGNIDLPLNLLKPSKRFRNRDVLECNACELRKHCKAPVLPTPGKYNVMVIGEASGIEEDEYGKGFIGKSGQRLWHEIGLYGYTRDFFHVSNVNKCYPGKKIKNPDRKHVEKCRKWLDEEIRNVQPFLILALGNANVKFFTDKDTGIMKKTDEIGAEWNEEYGAWLCFCLHPASTLYNAENNALFEKGIKNFCEKLKNLGEVPF
jgi:DNA polymerase